MTETNAKSAGLTARPDLETAPKTNGQPTFAPEALYQALLQVLYDDRGVGLKGGQHRLKPVAETIGLGDGFGQRVS